MQTAVTLKGVAAFCQKIPWKILTAAERCVILEEQKKMSRENK